MAAVPHRYCNCVERHVEKRWSKPEQVVGGVGPLVVAVGVDKNRQRPRHTNSEQRQPDNPSPDVRTSVRGRSRDKHSEQAEQSHHDCKVREQAAAGAPPITVHRHRFPALLPSRPACIGTY